MKTRFICYALALLLASPVLAAEATITPENTRMETVSGKNISKNKKPKKQKKGKKAKRKHIYRPGARQN